MKQNLNQMTNVELKQYISENRNDDEAFRAALGVLLSRRDHNAPTYSSPLPGTSFQEAVDEITAIFEKHLEEKRKKAEKLDELLKDATPDMQHDEFDWGDSVGAEAQ